jgi:hypothetical protein
MNYAKSIKILTVCNFGFLNDIIGIINAGITFKGLSQTIATFLDRLFTCDWM